VPAPPPGLTYVEIAAGDWYSMARLCDGSLVAWGSNDNGQCDAPVPPPGLTYVEVDAGDAHTVARLSDGTVVAWGDNSAGQCTVPAPPAGLSYVEVAAGAIHTVARLSDGSVVAWGENSAGQCNVPVPPPGLSYVEIAASSSTTVARLEASSPWSSYCTPGTTSHGCEPSITASGVASASSGSGFKIAAVEVQGKRRGMILYSIDDSGFTPFPWGQTSSWMCLAAPLQRTTMQKSGGSPFLCDGTLSLDWNAYVATHAGALGNPFAPGQHVFAQAWFRDPSIPGGTMLSDALEFVVQP
jgi:hypothetical protein